MAVDLTVAIPTYNGATRLPAVLAQLKQQTGTSMISWEVLVVDNNSTDRLDQVVRDIQGDWLPDVPLRYCNEPQQGAAFARLRAVQEARGLLIGFLDDDTIPAVTWVQAACLFAKKYPRAGAIGSQIHGDYEVEPPPNFERIASFLAITERGTEPQRYEPQLKMLPPSAGLVVRRAVWREHVPARPVLSGRSQTSMLNSEDLEAIMHIQNAGWEIWYNPAMELFHQIPARRLSREGLLFIVRSTGLARHHIRMLRLKPWQRPLLFPLGWLNDLRKAGQFFWQHRDRFATDTVLACQMEFLRSSLISPFYLWWQRWNR
jgi:cellulose synthase/poly-beta-1,6-N-acetylglucosamine synthase-like glycosyltransferase